MAQTISTAPEHFVKSWCSYISTVLLAIALAASLVCSARAQVAGNSPLTAREASIWGHERSVPGLEKLVKLRDPNLIDDYRRNFHIANTAIYRANGGKPYALPDGVEDLIIRNYGDPVIGANLRGLLSADGLRYQSRTLFNLMYAEYDNWQSERVRFLPIPLSTFITQTDLEGIEAPLLQILKRDRKPELQNDYAALIRFLAARKYAPLQPTLIHILKEAPINEQVAQVSINTLRKLSPATAAEVAAQRLSRLGAQYFTANYPAETENMILAIAFAPVNEVGSIEPALLEWVKAARAAKAPFYLSHLLEFLAKRNYRPAVPALLEFERESQPGDRLIPPIFDGLLRLDAETAGDVAIRRIKKFRQQVGEQVVSREIDMLLGILSRIPIATRVDLVALEAALPDSLGVFGYTDINKLYAMRDKSRLASISQRFLSENRHLQPAVQAILEFGSPESWLNARKEIERLQQNGKLTDVQTRHVLSLLNTKLGDPAKHIAERTQQSRRQQFAEKLSALQSANNALQQAKNTPAELYIKTTLEFADRLRNLTAEFADVPDAKNHLDQISLHYIIAGNVARFALRNPRRALEYYAMGQATGHGLATFAAADTYQFDLRDKTRAIAEYQRLLDRRVEFNTNNDVEVSLRNWSRKWLRTQIEFLKTGKVFAGPINQDDIAGLGTYLYFGAGTTTIPLDPFGIAALSRQNIDPTTQIVIGAPILERAAIGRKLPTLPASIFVLAQTLEHYPLLPDARSILRYLDRHDPAGFATASLLGMALQMNSRNSAMQKRDSKASRQSMESDNSVLLAAAELFSKERKISLRQEADARLASPEKTWNLLIASLKTGDLNTAMTCLTPNMQGQFRPVFSQMTKSALREMAESFSAFGGGVSMGDGMYEAYASRGKHAGAIQFVKENGMWRIAAM